MLFQYINVFRDTGDTVSAEREVVEEEGDRLVQQICYNGWVSHEVFNKRGQMSTIVCGQFYTLVCEKLPWHTEIEGCKTRFLHLVHIKFRLFS